MQLIIAEIDGVYSAKADPCGYTLQCKAKPRHTGNVLHSIAGLNQITLITVQRPN